MYKFAAFVPHPPIIIPEIGKENIKYCKKTVQAMQKISESIENKNIDTVIFISPHTVLSPTEMTISYAHNAKGDLKQFNNDIIVMQREINMDIAKRISEKATKLGVRSRLFSENNHFFIDHGVSVPLYFLQDNLPASTKIIIIGYSLLSNNDHIKFGKAIFDIIKNSEENIAVIASGDLSHRIFEPGSEYIGQNFDNQIVNNIQSNSFDKIYKIDKFIREEAGECGYRSMIILLSTLENIANNPEVLSYEAPFGVGYLVADFNING